MEYAKLQSVLKRYSFESKMNIAQKYSRDIMSMTGLIDCTELKDKILPWELETFVLLSVKAKEWQYNHFEVDNPREFRKIIDCIRRYQHPKLRMNIGKITYLDYVMLALSAVQFDIQDDYLYKQYRYNYYFNFISDNFNAQSLFKSKFGCNYSEFLNIAQFLWIGFAYKKLNLSQATYNFLSNKYCYIIKQLSITREEYIKKIDAITTDNADYLYCLRPSYSFPFIEEQNMLYLPLPHLIMRATTSSLLFRLTDGDNALMDMFGKNVFEKYLYKTILESNLFDEVYPEEYYYVKKNQNRTLDVLSRKGDYFIFFDSKSFSPKHNLRTFSLPVFKEEVNRLAEACKQVYKHVRGFFPNRYNPFHYPCTINPNNIFGFVVIREDPHIRAEYIYDRTADMLHIEKDSIEFEWLCKHVGIIEISTIEKYCFTQSNILDAILDHYNNAGLNDSWFSNPMDKSKIVSKSVLNFQKGVQQGVLEIANELEEAGVLKFYP